MKIENKSDAMYEIIKISIINNISIKLAKACLCDVCDYCVSHKGECVLKG